MTTMTPDDESALYADPDHQVPQGPPVRRKGEAQRAPYPCGSPKTSYARSATMPLPMTDQSPAGSDAPPSTSWNALAADRHPSAIAVPQPVPSLHGHDAHPIRPRRRLCPPYAATGCTESEHAEPVEQSTWRYAADGSACRSSVFLIW